MLTIEPVVAALEEFDYAFAENGLTAYKLGEKLPSQSFIKYLGEERYKPFVNFILHYLADIDIPIKRCVLSGVAKAGYEVADVLIVVRYAVERSSSSEMECSM